MAPTTRGSRRRGQVLQPVALNNPFHNLKIGRRTGKPLNIKARKDSDGFDNIDDYFRDEDLDSEDENSCPPKFKINSNETKESLKEKQTHVQRASSEASEENSTVVSNSQGSESTRDTQVARESDGTRGVDAEVNRAKTPVVTEDFNNDEGTAVKSESMADPTPIIHGTRKRLHFQSESSPVESEVKSKVSPKKRSTRKRVSNRSAPDGESDEEIDVTGVDSDNDNNDGNKENDDVLEVVSSTSVIEDQNSNSVGSRHEENDKNNSPVTKSLAKATEATNLPTKRKGNTDNNKESNRPRNYVNDKSQLEKTNSMVDIMNLTNNNTFLTIGNASHHATRVCEEIPPSPASSSGLIDESVICESTRHKCMSPEFGPSLKIDDVQEEQLKKTNAKRRQARKKTDKQMKIEVKQKKGRQKTQDQIGRGNKSHLENNEEVFEVHHNTFISGKSSESSTNIDLENIDSGSTDQEAIKKTEIKKGNNCLKMNKTTEAIIEDAVADNSNNSQSEGSSKLSQNTKRRKRAATLMYKPASRRNRKRKQNLKERISKKDNDEECTITEETSQKDVSKNRRVKSRKVCKDLVNSYSDNQDKNSETEEIATEQEIETGGHPSPLEPALSPTFSENDKSELASTGNEDNTPCPSALSGVKKSILKSGKSATSQKRKVTIRRKSQSQSSGGGNDADDEAQGNDEPVNKRRSSVSFAPKSTFLGSTSDDDQPLPAEGIKGTKVKLSFVSRNSSFSSEDRTFTPGETHYGSSHLQVTSSSESSPDTSPEINQEISLNDNSSGSVNQVSAAASGLRRSRRNRVSPLKFWKNERIEYDTRRKSGFTFKRIIRNPTPKVQERKKPRAKAKKKNPAEDSEDDVSGSEELPEGLTEEINPTATVINPDTEEEVALDLFHVPEMLNFLNVSRKPATESDPLIIDKYMQHNQFSVGQFVLRGGADKGKQHVRHDTMIFYVLKGKILVTVHGTTAVLNKGSTFFVPQGNAYQVKNLRKSDATILFVQVKGYVDGSSPQ